MLIGCQINKEEGFMSETSEKKLRMIAESIRLVTLQTMANFGSGHIGGAMSIVETLAVLYGSELLCDPKDPSWEKRDRLVCSKGHAGAAVYAALALRGFFPQEKLAEYNQSGGSLPGHCDMNKVPGIDMTTGSLGQGMSAACGMALAMKMDDSKNVTYLIVGDGECDEGQIWEGAMFAAHYHLSNLIMFVDKNGQQLDGFTKTIMNTESLAEKFEAFGWFTQEVNGHDPEEIKNAIRKAKQGTGKPNAIILDTIKGYGIPFAEGREGNHHMTFTPEMIQETTDIIYARLSELSGTPDGKKEGE